MRFLDEVSLKVASGAGGSGASSFRREKHVAFGGPDGGDGGRGGDVVVVGHEGMNTLLELRAKPVWRAEDGYKGMGNRMTGACGRDTVLHMPVGTRVTDADTGELLVDVTQHEQRFVVAKGGTRGLGNIHFKSSRNRAPTKCTPGKPGVERNLSLELMLMADVGLLGFPNAGKSTLVTKVSAARPRVADYHFTTLVPSLGVVKVGLDAGFVIADIPGLIEGAADGAGLGHRFLRHIKRTRVLVHLISLGPDESVAPVERYKIIRAELERFDSVLSSRPEILVLTKSDLLMEDELAEVLAEFAEQGTSKSIKVISAITGDGAKQLVLDMWAELQLVEKPAFELFSGDEEANNDDGEE